MSFALPDILALLLKYGFLFVTPSYLGWLVFSAISRHSLCLSGQRISRDGVSAYRFAVQNNEDDSLVGRHTLTISIGDELGHFIGEHPVRVYAGCSTFATEMKNSGKEWCMSFDELPAYDTWTIRSHHKRTGSQYVHVHPRGRAVAR